MKKKINMLFGAVLLMMTAFAQPALAIDCSVAQFTAGSPAVNASDCFASGIHHNQAQAQIESIWSRDFTQVASSETSGLTVNPSASGVGFDWTLEASVLNGYRDAAFVVKQANPNSSNNVDGVNWVAYLFNNISDSFGNFMTNFNFTVNDYSNIRVFGSGEAHAVPEIDAASAGIVMSLLLGMVAMIRERRRVQLVRS